LRELDKTLKPRKIIFNRGRPRETTQDLNVPETGAIPSTARRTSCGYTAPQDTCEEQTTTKKMPQLLLRQDPEPSPLHRAKTCNKSKTNWTPWPGPYYNFKTTILTVEAREEEEAVAEDEAEGDPTDVLPQAPENLNQPQKLSKKLRRLRNCATHRSTITSDSIK